MPNNDAGEYVWQIPYPETKEFRRYLDMAQIPGDTQYRDIFANRAEVLKFQEQLVALCSHMRADMNGTTCTVPHEVWRKAVNHHWNRVGGIPHKEEKPKSGDARFVQEMNDALDAIRSLKAEQKAFTANEAGLSCDEPTVIDAQPEDLAKQEESIKNKRDAIFASMFS